MATLITAECINCGACEPECPNTAIYQGGAEWELNGVKHDAIAQDLFYIVPEKCTECVGFFDKEACAAVCPVDCCIPDPNIPETEEVLLARARQLHPDKTFGADVPSRFRKAGGPPPAAPKAAEPPSDKATSAPAAPKPVPLSSDQKAPVAVETQPAAPAAEKPPPVPAAPGLEAAPPQPVAAKAAAASAEVRAAPSPPRKAAAETQKGESPPVARAEKATPPSKPPVAPVPKAPRGPKTFAGELPGTFEEVAAQLDRPNASAPRGLKALLAALGRRRSTSQSVGHVPFDGFHDGGEFEEKQERERRYGEVYSLQERGGAYLLRLEFPRRVPHSALKDELGLPDEMPPYDYDLGLQNGYFVVKGRMEDPNLRKLAAVSPAFPPNFIAHIKLPGPVSGFKHRFVDKNLEVVLVKQ